MSEVIKRTVKSTLDRTGVTAAAEAIREDGMLHTAGKAVAKAWNWLTTDDHV